MNANLTIVSPQLINSLMDQLESENPKIIGEIKHLENQFSIYTDVEPDSTIPDALRQINENRDSIFQHQLEVFMSAGDLNAKDVKDYLEALNSTEYASKLLNEYFEITPATLNETWMSMHLLDDLSNIFDSAPENTSSLTVLDEWIKQPLIWTIIQDIKNVTTEFNDYTALIEMTLNNTIISDLVDYFDGPIVQSFDLLTIEMLSTGEIIREFNE